MTSTAEILKAARKLIEKPDSWTTEYYARDANGSCVEPESEHAVCFCSIGAIKKASSSVEEELIARSLMRKLIPTGIAAFNDFHTHSEVLDLFSKAIKAAEGEQS